MADTPQKAHATWSASATSRNWACAGALTLASQIVDKEGEAAAWGTACHAVAEDCLRTGRDPSELIDRTIKTKEHEIEVDEELAETARVYIDYVNSRLAEGGELIGIEERFDLDKLKPPFDAGGTADSTIYFREQKLLETVDLKGGRGVRVEVTENKQLRTYGLGAALKYTKLPIEKVMSTIVQPRIQHKDGVIRSETYHIMDLAEWANDLLERMKASAAAQAAYAKITGDLTREKWAAEFLSPGDHCANSFCPAQGFCPALEKRALDAAGVWFDDLGTAQLSNTPDSLDPLKLSQVLDAADMIESFLKACRALAHHQVEMGVEIPNYILVDKIGRRRWRDEDAVAGELFLKADLTMDEIFAQKLKSPAQIEKVLGKRKDLIAGLVETPVTGTNLVRADKTTRKAAKPAAQKHFNVIE